MDAASQPDGPHQPPRTDRTDAPAHAGTPDALAPPHADAANARPADPAPRAPARPAGRPADLDRPADPAPRAPARPAGRPADLDRPADPAPRTRARSAGRPARPVRAVAPWVRTRLRTSPGPALALTALVLITSFLAAAFPRAVDTYEADGLRHELAAAVPERSALRFTVGPQPDDDPEARADALRPETLTERYRQIQKGLPAPLRADTTESSYGVRITKPVRAGDRWLPELDGGRPVFTLSAPAALAENSRLRAGRLPRPAPDGADTVEAAVTTDTAKTLRAKVGSTVHLPRAGDATPLAIRITAIVEPLRPERSNWSFEPVLRTPALRYTPPPVTSYWHAGLLLAPGTAPALLSVSYDTEAYWRVAVDPAALDANELPRAVKAVAALESGPAQVDLRTAVSPGLETATDLDEILLGFDGIRSSIRPVVSVAAFGIGTVAAVVLLMAGGLAAARRHTELSLVRARGGSVRGIAGRLLAEVAVPVLPAAALGYWLALVLVPGGRPLPALLAAGAVALIASAALPLRAVFLTRGSRPPAGRDDLVRARPSRGRTVAELTLLVLTVAAVLALRRGGTSDGQVNELVSAAPVLVGMVAALLLVRVYPVPLRLATLPMARRRGAIGFLSLARAGRTPAAAALVLLALLVALTTAAFGGSVLAGVTEARDRASLVVVGADARLDATEGLPPGAADRVRKVSGVREVVSVYREFDVEMRDGDQDIVTLIAVEPDAYARLARATGLGGFDADELRKPAGGSDALPAIASPAVAARLGDGPVSIGSVGGLLTVELSAVREITPAASDGDFLIVDASGLAGERPATTLLVSGPTASGSGLEAAVPAATVTLRAAERAAFTESPVQTGAERIYLVAVAAGAGYAVLAVLLSLLRAAPERAALLARLRTMGLTRRQGRRLLILESLPQTLLAGAGGALVGWGTIHLLAPGVDLARLALAAQGRVASLGPVRLQPDAWSLLLPALAVVVIAAGVAAAQAWLSTRRTTTTELRVGDPR
ncbi:FtsX-like permease family protein [Streptomyces sp. NPDC020965]|uniref:FtsX-like permease family protein n=1 Tax=Streptomyces sp. NPDC020965 TaxID=3365105 RepID=UPI0037AE4A17